MRLIEFRELHSKMMDFRNRFYAFLRKLEWEMVSEQEQIDIAKNILDLAKAMMELQNRIAEIEEEMMNLM